MAVLALVTENWKLSTISAAETSRTVQTLIRNGKIITSILCLGTCISTYVILCY